MGVRGLNNIRKEGEGDWGEKIEIEERRGRE